MCPPLPASPPPAALFVQVCPLCCLTYSSAAPADCPDCRPTAAIAPGLVDHPAPLGPPTMVRISNPPLAASIAWARGITSPKGSDHA